MIFPFKGRYPSIHPSVFLCPDVVIVGDVTLREDASVWFGSVIRGDVHSISIGPRTNIQDNCTVHVTHKRYSASIGSDVTVGHGAVLHGCTIQDACLIGMNATVLDGSVVESESLIAAGSLVLSNFIVPSGKLVGGVPAKVLRNLTEEERAYIHQSARNYLRYIAEYRESGDLRFGTETNAFLTETREQI
jgi:carbonic anhydrase/acetyltransferase-like protein (isoleucine patch superfamily)